MVEKLKLLLEDTLNDWECDVSDETIYQIAEHLVDNGVIANPCKVGDKMYVISRYYTGSWEIFECEVNDITIYKTNTFIRFYGRGNFVFAENASLLGKTFFRTQKEAEQALKGGAE